jgi:hypothetical protein
VEVSGAFARRRFAECNSAIQQIANLRYVIDPNKKPFGIEDTERRFGLKQFTSRLFP